MTRGAETEVGSASTRPEAAARAEQPPAERAGRLAGAVRSSIFQPVLDGNRSAERPIPAAAARSPRCADHPPPLVLSQPGPTRRRAKSRDAEMNLVRTVDCSLLSLCS